MTVRPLVAVGITTGLVLKLVEAINRVEETWDFLGFINYDPSLPPGDLYGASMLGGTEALERRAATGELWAFNNVNLTPELCREADVLLDRLECRRTSLIHPDIDMALASHGQNCGLFDGTRVGPGAVLGRHVTARMGVLISHDVQVGDYVYLSPGVTLCGRAVLEDGVDVGAGSTVLPGVRIGADTFVGAGSLVKEDLPPGVVAVGYPARIVKRTRE